jgi:hypothetical protein
MTKAGKRDDRDRDRAENDVLGQVRLHDDVIVSDMIGPRLRRFGDQQTASREKCEQKQNYDP